MPQPRAKPTSDTAESTNKTTEGETKPEEVKKPEESESAAGNDTPASESTPAIEFHIADEDLALLESLFGAESTEKIISLHKRALAKLRARPSELGRVPTSVIDDRDVRIKMHQAIRRIFNSQLESSTDHDGLMTISAAPNRNKASRGPKGEGDKHTQRGRINWDELGGPYLHFTIYKENKDTMEVLSFIARQLKMNPKNFQFAGTKDRRGVTAQRACVVRLQADRLARMNQVLRNAKVGDFEYRKHGLDLGDLWGNEFVVTLRECDIPGVNPQDSETAVSTATELVGTALRNLRERGYFNYYGLQRFGTFATRTDSVGLKMLQGDFKGACDAILHYSPHILAAAQSGADNTTVSSDDRDRAEALYIFESTGRSAEAMEKLPRKFYAEANLMRHLSRNKTDHLGALQTIPRNLRMMYVHAYQSLVWNFAVGERWSLYGDKVVEGDLVLVNEHRDKEEETATAATPAVDADGEVIIAPQAEDSACAADDMFTRARALTAAEAASGKYNIFDVVLTLPGYDVVYPPNQMTDFYKRFMGSEQGGGLDPFDMRRKWKEVSLSGSYRKLLSRMGPDYSIEVKPYARDETQFVQTDLERLQSASAEGGAPAEGGASADAGAEEAKKDKIAVVLKFQLGSSQYATMALRELTRGKVKAYRPDFGSGR